jgi:hypothetical protein
MLNSNHNSDITVGGSDLLTELERNGELAFNPLFVDITGSVTAALLLSACSQDTEVVLSEDGWTCLNVDRWHRLTRMSKHEQRTARRILTDLKLLELRRVGFPSISEYRVNFDRLTSEVIQIANRKIAERKSVEQIVH